MLPRYPLYIVSKGRWESRLTARALEEMKVPYRIVVEEQERKQYASVIDPKKVLVLDKKYQRDYDTADSLGDSKSKGPGPARNFVWDHAVAEGFKRHWVMDDNIDGFYRFNDNLKVLCTSPSFWAAQEDFCDRYVNVAMAGPNYFMFCSRKNKIPKFVANTRIYSCNLILNEAPFRWRGRYNEDTDLSLRMLKAGWCTIQFNAFLQRKTPTQVLKGGNTAEFYAREGTAPKSEMLAAMHPDVAKVKTRFGRHHHYVDYRPFRTNKLIRVEGLRVPEASNDYGMRLRVEEGAGSKKRREES